MLPLALILSNVIFLSYQIFWYSRAFHSCGPAKEYWCLWPHSKSAVDKIRTSAVSATACHQGSTARLVPGPHALLKLHQQHSSGIRKLSHPFICRWYSLIVSWPHPGFCVKRSTTKRSNVQQVSLPLNLFWTFPKQRSCGLVRRMPLSPQVWLLPSLR